MRISDWSSDVCSSDLPRRHRLGASRHLRLAPVGQAGTAQGRCCAGIARGVGDASGALRPASQKLNILDKAGPAGLLARDCSSPADPGLKLEDRKSVVLGKRVSVSVDLGGRRIMNKKNHITI